MLNIHDLEKRWKIYKIKSFLPYIFISISLIIMIFLTYNFYPNSKKSIPPKKQIIQNKKVQITDIPKKNKDNIVKQITTIDKNSIPPQIVIQTQKLQPSMNFLQNFQHQKSQPQYIQQSTAKRSKKIVKEKALQKTISKIIPIKKEPKVSIIIERKETQNDIFEIIKRFKKNKNPALSLFVAKKYYELGNYEQAYNYALITNQINSNIEASWIVFVQSLVKLHKKNKAIHTLQEYIKVSHSSNAEILLNEITSGKFK